MTTKQDQGEWSKSKFIPFDPFEKFLIFQTPTWKTNKLIYLTAKASKMGATPVKFTAPPLQLTPSSQPSLSLRSSQKFLIRQVLTQSPEQHQELIASIAKYKQYSHPNVVRLMDAHSVHSHNLCSVISQLYVVIEKPQYSLRQYVEKMAQENCRFRKGEVESLLTGCCRGIDYLRRQGQDYGHIGISQIYLESSEKGELIAKIMSPHFKEEDYEFESSETTVEQTLSEIFKRYVNHQNTSSQLFRLLHLLGQNQIGVRQAGEYLQPVGHNKENEGQLYSQSQCELKKSKVGIRLTKEANRNRSKTQRESIATVTSNSSSLMIDGGDESERMFKDFYEHFDDISEIHANPLSEDSGHQFPKKYLKSKAFRKMNATFSSSEWLSTKSLWSDQKAGQGRDATRDQTLKENINLGVDSRPFLLESAKLVESYIDRK